jgi:hypothetical protein
MYFLQFEEPRKLFFKIEQEGGCTTQVATLQRNQVKMFSLLMSERLGVLKKVRKSNCNERTIY